jgi:hypothetical protein
VRPPGIPRITWPYGKQHYCGSECEQPQSDVEKVEGHSFAADLSRKEVENQEQENDNEKNPETVVYSGIELGEPRVLVAFSDRQHTR